MTQPIIIFKVNDLKNGQGYINAISTFNKNVILIRPNYLEELKNELAQTGREQVVRFEVAGRYVVLVAMNKNINVVKMVFFDLKKDENTARSVLGSIIRNETDESLHDELGVDFLFAFKRCNLTYDEYYDLVELRLDKSELNWQTNNQTFNHRRTFIIVLPCKTRCR